MSSEKIRVGRTSGVTLAMLERRNKCVIGLYLSGLTEDEILETISDLHRVFGWGNLGSTRQVQRILSKHFEGRPMSAREVKDCSFGLRDAALNSMEKCVEDVALYAFSVKNSDSSEYIEAIKTQAEIMQMIVDVRGFNPLTRNYGKWMNVSMSSTKKHREAVERAGSRRVVEEKLMNSV